MVSLSAKKLRKQRLTTCFLRLFLAHLTCRPRPDMGHPPFLYGTHYSTPGYCLYFLVRKAPDYMLRLQSGQFDKPDRLFRSVEVRYARPVRRHE
jgi:hypothetical protein